MAKYIGKAMSVSTLTIANVTIATVTVLCTRNYASMDVREKQFYEHKNQCTPILNLLSSEYNKACKIDKLVLQCENEILKNTTKTTFDDKNIQKNNYTIHKISLEITCLLYLLLFLLAAITITQKIGLNKTMYYYINIRWII